MKTTAVSLSLALTLAPLLACGSSFPPPRDEWSAAQMQVGRAEAVGAVNVPDAKLHLRLAEEDLASSRRLMGNDNYRAETLAELANAEAQLAASVAMATAASKDARQAADDLARSQAAAAQAK